MKFLFASLAAITNAAHLKEKANDHVVTMVKDVQVRDEGEGELPDYLTSDFGNHYPGAMGNYEEAVRAFQSSDTLWSQADYEERMETEAQLMVGIESIRGFLIQLDEDIHALESCIEVNTDEMRLSRFGISLSEQIVELHEDDLEVQNVRLGYLQERCKENQDRLDEDRAALVLYC